jgi:hypothetical protein
MLHTMAGRRLSGVHPHGNPNFIVDVICASWLVVLLLSPLIVDTHQRTSHA